MPNPAANRRTCQPHNHRAIVHLREAKDESQQWPHLHGAIRTAGKAYQTDGAMPDWPAPEALTGEADHSD